MRTRISAVIFGVMLFALSGRLPLALAEQGATQASASSPLDGSTWSVKVTPDTAAKKSGEKPFNDNLIFQGGNVTMSACVKMGFAPSTYTASKSGEAWSFNTEQTSPKEGKTVWTASIAGNTISGTLTWTKANGVVLHYRFSGKKSAKSTSS